MRIGFAAAVACGFYPHQTRVLTVLHVAHQNTVFDQHVLSGRRAFVINGDRSAAVRNGAIVQNGHAGCCNALAHKPCKGRGALTVKVAFQTVTNRFMKKNTRPTRPKDNVHDARRRRFGAQVHQGDAQSLACFGLPVCRIDQAIKPDTTAATGAARFAATVFFDDHADIHSGHRADIASQRSVGAQDRHFL